MIEYGIASSNAPEILHRGPMTLSEAEEWLNEWNSDLGKPFAFIIVSRKVSPWKPLPRHRA